LKEICACIAEDDSVAARKFIPSLFMAVERLSVFPESGRVVPEFKDVTIRSEPDRSKQVIEGPQGTVVVFAGMSTLVKRTY
jgi:plasmid stabilization system protein ParE